MGLQQASACASGVEEKLAGLETQSALAFRASSFPFSEKRLVMLSASVWASGALDVERSSPV